jgi:DNA ligase-4
MDPVLAEWFKIDKTSPQGEDAKSDEDSVTDEDSDNADVVGDAEGEKEEADLDEWFSINKEPVEAIASEASGTMVPPVFLCLFFCLWPSVTGQLCRRQDGRK